MAMAEVVCNRRMMRSAVRLVDGLDATLHMLQLRLRVMQLRRDPVLRRELDEMARETERVEEPVDDRALDRYIAELAERQ